MWIDTLKEKVQKNPIFSVITLIIVVLASTDAVISNITTVQSFVQNNLIASIILFTVVIIVVVAIIISAPYFNKHELLKNVERLKPGVNISMYLSKFDAPIVTNHHKEKGEKEHIFANKYFYLNVVTDVNDVVKCFVVTVKDKTFKPTFKSPGYPLNNPSFQIKLGVSTFSDLPSKPNYLRSWLGAHYGFSYYETYYFGRPGGYQEFGFGLNCAGYQPKDLLKYRSVFSKAYNTTSYSDQVFADLQNFRSEEYFNTYSISSSRTSIKDCFDISLGVDYNQVQALEDK